VATSIGKLGVKAASEVGLKAGAKLAGEEVEHTAARISINRTSGMAFESVKIDEKNLAKNTITLVGDTSKGLVAVIPDSLSHNALWEIKNMSYVYKTPQLEAMASIARDAKLPLNLVVPEGARVSGPLKSLIKATGGRIFP
jgi:hypothetical protein